MSAVVYAHTDQFFLHWNKLTFTLSCDISDLTNGSRAGAWPQTIYLTSHRTGKCLEFHRVLFECDEEGDLQFALYYAKEKVKGRLLPLKVFND